MRKKEVFNALRYDVNEQPPQLLAAALGLQAVVLILAGIVLIPIIVLKAAGSSEELMAWAVFATLLVSGIITIVQARPIGPVGAGYVLFMGTSGAFIAVSTLAVERGSLPLLASLVTVSSLVQFLFSARLSLLRRVITPTVGGTVLMLIAVTVTPICFRMLASVPDHIDPTSAVGPLIAGTTLVATLGPALFTTGHLRLWAPLIGVLTGCILASSLNVMDLTALGRAPWIGLPHATWPGFDLSFDARFFSLLPSFVIVTIVGAIETYGDGIAIQRVSRRSREPVDFKAVQGAVNADGVGNLLSGLACTLPNTTYATSISVAELTGVAARGVGIYAGLILMALAFFPKISALLRTVPDVVVGAYVLILIVLLFAHGLRLVSEGGLSFENGLVVCLAFWLGIGFQNQLIFPNHLPEWAQTLLSNGMTAGALVAVLLTLLLSLKHRSQDRLRLDPSPGAVPALHDFLAQIATASGWDKTALDRLQLAGEEALLFLIEKADQAHPSRVAPIHVVVRQMGELIELEFMSGPGAENVESLVRELVTDAPASADDVGLRILSSLATELRHEQFRDRTYLLVTMESKPLV